MGVLTSLRWPGLVCPIFQRTSPKSRRGHPLVVVIAIGEGRASFDDDYDYDYDYDDGGALNPPDCKARTLSRRVGWE
jgi:hypothetical protein